MYEQILADLLICFCILDFSLHLEICWETDIQLVDSNPSATVTVSYFLCYSSANVQHVFSFLL